ncbi:MAG: nucleotidyl transferase AbiEii/AbiGii toxin family protein [Candidatus Omnitrophota bacterium]
MDKKIRRAQNDILAVFAKKARTFALAGGTALELYYLKHRSSVDLDFFSPQYSFKEIESLISSFRAQAGYRLKLENEFIASERAKVRFYTAPIKGSMRPLKIDFVEDVVFNKPSIRKIKGVRVYSAENIYLQKIGAIAGTIASEDDIGRFVAQGRQQARDVFDLYMLSKKIIPLHRFLESAPRQLQRGMVHWYRVFSRQDVMLELLDLDIYDKKFSSKKMIIYLEKEMKLFIKKETEL